MPHICISKHINIGSDDGLSPCRRQAIIRTNAGILLFGALGTNFSEILIKSSYIFIQENVLENVVWKTAAILSQPQCVKKRVKLTGTKRTHRECEPFIYFLGIAGLSPRQVEISL